MKKESTAFPTDPAMYGSKAVPGMSLRDWFAGMAMQGLATGLEWRSGRIFNSDELAFDAYNIADAMLLARGLMVEREKEK